MLFACLERKYICAFSVHILRRTDDTARELADMVRGTCEEAYLRTAIAERNAKTLRISADDVGTPFARSPDNGKR